jgi:NAD(P)H-dependent flavin oxidoreductase YrpB (nitropropane dioxygenase family)
VIRTRLCDLLGIEVPILQAPIGGVSNPRLAAAVSNAGGLGMIAMTWSSQQDTHRVLAETLTLTEKPFAVNYVLEWDVSDKVDICLEHDVKLFSFFWGDPVTYTKRIHDAGGIIMHTVGSSEEALRCIRAGVDVIVAQGWEAGGHVRGEVTTLALVPCVVDAVAPVPVVAAGGIADGRAIAAALALGASGAMLGTRFVVCEEANSHSVYRQKILEATEASTVHTSLFDGGWENAPHRVLRNTTYEKWSKAGCPPPGQRPGEHEVVSRQGVREIPRYDSDALTADIEGSAEEQALYAGQGAGLIRACKTAGEILADLTEDTGLAIDRLQQLNR